MTFEEHHSLVVLPDAPGFRPRDYDPRFGYGGTQFADLSQGFDGTYRSGFINRWRLIPRIPPPISAANSSSRSRRSRTTSIPAFPRRIARRCARAATGGRRCSRRRASERVPRARPAGWRRPDGRALQHADVGASQRSRARRWGRATAIRAPARSCAPWCAWTRGVRWSTTTSGRARVPASGAQRPQCDAETFAMSRRRQHAAHEIGHTLGLSHNYIAHVAGAHVGDGLSVPAHHRRCRRHARPARRLAQWTGRVGHAGHPAGLHVVPRRGEREGRAGRDHEGRSRAQRAVHQRHVRRRRRVDSGGDALGGRHDDVRRRRAHHRRCVASSSTSSTNAPSSRASRWRCSTCASRTCICIIATRWRGCAKYVGGMDFTFTLRGDGQVPTRIAAGGRPAQGAHHGARCDPAVASSRCPSACSS